MNLPLFLALVVLQGQALDLPNKFISPKPKPDALLATVGGTPILASNLEPYLWDWRAHEALQDLVTHQMIAAEAARLSVRVSDEDIQKELDKQLEQVKKELQPGQTADQLLLERGFPKSRLYLRIRSEQLLNKLVMQSFDPKQFVKVATIVVRSRSEQASELAQALKRAEDAYNALRNGEAWGDVLARHSDDPGALQSQGMLGWRELRAFPPTVQDEMRSLKPGAITKPAQTANGIQIFRIEAIGAQAEGAAIQELGEAFLTGSRQRYLDGLRAKTKVEIHFKN